MMDLKLSGMFGKNKNEGKAEKKESTFMDNIGIEDDYKAQTKETGVTRSEADEFAVNLEVDQPDFKSPEKLN